MIETVKTSHIGFCYGVNRAVKTVLREAEKRRTPIYTLGPLLHNPQMVAMLEQRGVTPIENIFELTAGVVAFRSHGILREEEEYIRTKGIQFIDTTCPWVKRVRKHAVYLEKKGYKVVIAGDERHPEVKSVLSYLESGGMVLKYPCSIEAKKVGVVSQTTLDQETLSKVIQGLTAGAEELRIYNTICESTNIRTAEAVRLARTVEAMLIVGGKNSSNTTKLYITVKALQPNTYHIETEQELLPEWFKGRSRVGIAGGASTPDFIIDGVERRVKNF